MIAVTGANGLLGSYVIRKLVEEKIPFVALRRKTSNCSHLHDIAESITWCEADVDDYESLLEAFKNVTGVIHCAAMVSYHQRDKKQMMDINVEGTKHVVNACLQLSIKRLIHVSSVAALGKDKKNQQVDENNKWVESANPSNYALSKYMAEIEVWRGIEEGLPAAIVNPSVILAPTDWNKSSAQLFKYAWQQRPFYTEGSFSAVDVRDVAHCIVKLYSSTIVSERFIISAETISYKQFFDKTASAFNKKPPHILVKKRWMQVAAFFEKIRSILTGSNPLITKETAQLAGNRFVYNNEKIKKALNIDFQPIEETIAWCCREYMKKIPKKM